MSTNVIELNGISKYYGDLKAVDDFHLRIAAGESIGLIGHNGAGKSTVFKLMLGLIRPCAGQIFWHGELVNDSMLREVRQHIGYLPENLALFENLTGEETLQFFARLKRNDAKQIAALLDEVKLSSAAARRVATYSKGMRQRLGLAQALLGTPRILFLDEPTNGLDPEGVRDLYDAIEQRRQQGCTIIITSHILADIERRVQTLAIMKNGRLAAHGNLAQLRQQQTSPLIALLTIKDPAKQSAFVTELQQYDWINCTSSAQQLELRCQANDKLALLRVCQPLLEQLDDFSLRELSLEELFFGAQI